MLRVWPDPAHLTTFPKIPGDHARAKLGLAASLPLLSQPRTRWGENGNVLHNIHV